MIAALLLLATPSVWAQVTEYVTDVMLIGDKKWDNVKSLRNKYTSEGWILIDKDLNEGAGGAYIYLLYKKNTSDGSSDLPITDIKIRYGEPNSQPFDMGFVAHGRHYYYTQGGGNNDFNSNHCDVNLGCGNNSDYIYICYSKDQVGGPIAVTSITIDNNSSDGVTAYDGNQAADLNRGAGGEYIYMHISTSSIATIYVKNEQDLVNAVSINDANIYMMADITLGSEPVQITLPNTKLNLNGFELRGGGTVGTTEYNRNQVLTLTRNGNLTISDDSSDKSGKITKGYNQEAGGAIYVSSGAKLTLEGITISDCRSDQKGAAIYNEGTVVANGCKFIENICGSEAGKGGGIYNVGTLTINGGTFIDNSTGSGGGGGAIWNEGTLNMKGIITMTDNYSAGKNNLCLANGSKINVTGSLAGSSIGIGLPSTVTSQLLTSGFDSKNSGVDPSTIFIKDNAVSNYVMSKYNGEALLYKKPATESVDYLKLDGTTGTETCFKMSINGQIQLPKAGDHTYVLDNGWYVLDENITTEQYTSICVNGVVNLILKDGCTLSGPESYIEITGGRSGGKVITIWGQSGGTGSLIFSKDGTTTGNFSQWTCIGNNSGSTGQITINGGTIFCYGGMWSPAIGGKNNGWVTINRGTVTAKGYGYGAGIGSGPGGEGHVEINGGNVEATGGTFSAGIGGGGEPYGYGADGYVTITGGTVKATSGTCAIGGSNKKLGAAAIGGGSGDPENEPYSYHSGRGFVEITGGTVVAEGSGSGQCVGIGDGYRPKSNGSVSLSYINDVSINAKSYNGVDSYRGTVTLVKDFQDTEETPNSYGAGVVSDLSILKNKTLKPATGSAVTNFALADGSDNSQILSEQNGHTGRNVTLSGRTFWKDGSWNTICLPFAIADIENTPLAGATVKTLTGATLANGVLTLTFGEAVTALEAGKPYIIKWSPGSDISNPVFEGVTISNTHADVTVNGVTFTGTFSPVGLTADDKTQLYLGDDNMLYYATTIVYEVNNTGENQQGTQVVEEVVSIYSCRGYFVLNGISPARVVLND